MSKKNGEPWFVAKDVCDILGLGNTRKALLNFPEDERNTVTTSNGINEGPGNPNVNIVNEPGLYRLIFQSRKSEAEAFKRWVFHEVLPSIRKTGKYEFPVEAYKAACKAIEDKAKSMSIAPGVANTSSLVRFMSEWSGHMLREVEKRTAKAEIEAHVIRQRLWEMAIKYGTTAEKGLEAHKMAITVDERVEQLVKEWEAEWRKRKKPGA